MQYEAVLKAALADRGLKLERTEVVDDASWLGEEQLLVYVRGERKGIVDPILSGDLDNRTGVLRIADRVVAAVERRHPRGYALPANAQALGAT